MPFDPANTSQRMRSLDTKAIAWKARRISLSDAMTVSSHRYFNSDEKIEDLQAYAEWLAPKIADFSYIGYIAYEGDNVIAGAGAVLLDWGPTRGGGSSMRSRIVNVFTQPEWRRKGIAHDLLTAVMSECRERDIHQFCLGATPLATSLYESLGFKSYGAEMVIK